MCFDGLFKKAPSKKEKPKTLIKPAIKRTVKMVLCGNAAVGKTSITMRYKDGVFQQFHEPTLAGAYQEKKVRAKNG